MPQRPRRSRRRVVGGAVIVALVALAAMPAYLALSPSWRPVAVRLACTGAVIAGCVRALRWAREAAAPSAPEPLSRRRRSAPRARCGDATSSPRNSTAPAPYSRGRNTLTPAGSAAAPGSGSGATLGVGVGRALLLGMSPSLFSFVLAPLGAWPSVA